uniref:CAP-Gly domain-containing protein n=1 Tax=Noctiluca scintillans TaxID=2966 RepID=A0A7S1AEY1_NOCSC
MNEDSSDDRMEAREGARLHVNMLNVWATVRYCGPTSFASGQWVGLELDRPCGKNDGSVKGTRYFLCSPDHGLFVRPTTLGLSMPFRARLGEAGETSDEAFFSKFLDSPRDSQVVLAARAVPLRGIYRKSSGGSGRKSVRFSV